MFSGYVCSVDALAIGDQERDMEGYTKDATGAGSNQKPSTYSKLSV